MKKIVSAALAAILFCCALSGCGIAGETPSVKSNLTVIAARQANQPAPALSLMSDDLFEAARSAGEVSAIRLDGDPALADRFSVAEKAGFYTASQLDSRASGQAAQIEARIEAITAEAPESDLLAALCLAGRCAERADGETNTLEIFSNGLTTVDPLDMTAAVLHNLAVDEIIAALAERQALPDLSGYDAVRFYQLGETEAPQDPLTQRDQAALEAFWLALLTSCGLDESQITFVSTPSADSGAPAEGLPPISTVTVLQEGNAIAQTDGINVTLDRSSVAFLADTSELADPAAAREALRPTAATLTAHPELQVLVVGQTATVEQADICRELSLRRAERIAQELQALGADAGQITCVGMGCEPSPLRVDDLADDGSLIEELAEQNRVVHILDASTPLARQFAA